MIVRIVKMVFRPEEVSNFLTVFEASGNKIRNFKGCCHVELLHDKHNPCIFFTYSHWESKEHLEAYRHSELFLTTWAKTKVLFAEKPEAWSLEKIS